MTQGISFLHIFDIGQRNYLNPGANILSVTSTAPGDFDKSNLVTDSLRQVWRCNDIASWVEIVIQADLVTQIDTFCLLGHNLSEFAIVYLQADYDSAFVAPAENVLIPWSEFNMALCQQLSDEYPYYKVRILDPANPCGFIQIGRIVGGRAFTFSNNEDITDDFGIEFTDYSDKVKTEGYFRVSTEKPVARSLRANFSSLSTVPGEDTNFKGLRRMYKNVQTTKPFVTILDRTDPGFCMLWGQLESIPPEAFKVNRFMSQSIKITEMF